MSHHEHHHSSRSEEDSSQVRSIIRQINEDRPAEEKQREVVVRPDGTKVVRVTKKRKVMMTKEDHRRRGRRAFMCILFAMLLLAGGVAAFFSYRMSTMSGEAYLAERSQELAKLWGAKSVRCTGAVIDGFKFHIGNVVAEFPEEGMLESIELSGLDAELEVSTFFNRTLAGNELHIDRALVRLRSGVQQLHLPQAQGVKPWNFTRVVCPDLSLSFGDPATSPLSLQKTSAYMYRAAAASSMTVVTIEGGVLKMRGWKDINVSSGKVQFSQLAIEELSLNGTVDSLNSTTESSKTSVVLTGHIADAGSLAGPFGFVADNMNFADFTEGRYNHFFAARTQRPALHSGAPSTHILLPLAEEAQFPKFSGSFLLKEISISGFPAQQLILDHLEPVKRKRYMPPRILLSTARLAHEDGTMVLSFDESEMVERDLITLRGSIRVDADQMLSGTLDYGIPSMLTHAEYRDGKADPIFREVGTLAWLSTKLSGPAAHPEDDSHEADARAEIERSTRERIPFENIDLDRLNEHFNAQKERDFTLPQTPGSGLDGDGLDSRLSPQGGEHPLDSPF